MTNTSPKRRKFFDCVASTDGCDDTFEVRSRTTGNRVAWAGYWTHRYACRRVVQALTAAFNAAFASRRIQFDIANLAREQQEIAIVWSTFDVQLICRHLTDDQAWEVLKAAAPKLDELHEQFHHTVRAAAESLYGNAQTQGDAR